jgi:23S rRNA pseudouridine2605 synthase
MRLQKYLSSCGIASRRKSEELILEGRVKLNGSVVVKMGCTVTDGDIVEYDGKIIKPLDKKYLVLYKPPGFVCSRDDELKRKTVYDLVNDRSLFSIGRLDYNSSGLIILTNDGEFANSISHPSNEILKEYIVESYAEPPSIMIDDFIRGTYFENILYKADRIQKTGSRTLKVFLNEGKKREIRQVYRKYDVKIKSLMRVAIGKMNLKDLKLKKGEFVNLSLEKIKRMIYGQ